MACKWTWETQKAMGYKGVWVIWSMCYEEVNCTTGHLRAVGGQFAKKEIQGHRCAKLVQGGLCRPNQVNRGYRRGFCTRLPFLESLMGTYFAIEKTVVALQVHYF